MRDTAFQQHANMLSNLITEVHTKREEDKQELFRFVDDAKSSILDAMSTVPSLLRSDADSASDLTPPSVLSMNVTQQDKVQFKILQILERIDKKLDGKTSNTRTRLGTIKVLNAETKRGSSGRCYLRQQNGWKQCLL